MRVIRSALLAAVLCGWAAAALAAETTVYVSTGGNDQAKGTSEADAVATLQRALKLAEAASGSDLSLVRVSIAPGTYAGQSVTVRGNTAGVPILLTSGTGGRAVFDGDGRGGTWLTLKPRNGQASNLRISGLEVTNYETAIDAQGNRNNPELWAGGMEIRDNRFHKIGDIAKEGAQPSTAALRLVNSDRNVIAKNTFSNIKNNKLCGLLHALYIAHGSTDNRIEDNVFEDSCGDAVRFRDRSDNNVVRNNQFTDAWSQSPVSDWFCNPKQRGNCTKVQGECPSSNILVEGNKVTAKSAKQAKVFMPYGGKAPEWCGIQPGAQRGIVK